MRPLVKVGLVGAGYIGAFALASAVVTAYVAATSGPDRQNYGAMFAFGDDLLFLGVFGVAAVVPSGAALFFLRPYRSFWRVLSVTALVVATTAVAAFFDDLAWRGSDAFRRERLVGSGFAEDSDRAFVRSGLSPFRRDGAESEFAARTSGRHSDRGLGLRLGRVHLVPPFSIALTPGNAITPRRRGNGSRSARRPRAVRPCPRRPLRPDRG